MGELQKKNVLLQAQLDFSEKLNENLKQQLDKYQKVDEKPVNGKKKKDVNEVPKMEDSSIQ